MRKEVQRIMSGELPYLQGTTRSSTAPGVTSGEYFPDTGSFLLTLQRLKSMCLCSTLLCSLFHLLFLQPWEEDANSIHNSQRRKPKPWKVSLPAGTESGVLLMASDSTFSVIFHYVIHESQQRVIPYPGKILPTPGQDLI